MIDAHVHVWRIGANGCTWPDASLPALHRDFALADYRAASEAQRVVLVQTQEDALDTDWLIELASADPLVAGVVGWADLLAPDAPAQIAELAARPGLKGLRPMVQGRAADWYDDPALDPALTAMAAAGLVLDALVRPQHLAALSRLAARHPQLRIVIDHAGKPDGAKLAEWQDALAPLGGQASIWCKLSGLVTELPAAAIPNAVGRLLALFGAERLIWGSDWPVVKMAGDLAGWAADARALVPAAHHDAVFGGTAAHVYGLAA